MSALTPEQEAENLFEMASDWEDQLPGLALEGPKTLEWAQAYIKQLEAEAEALLEAVRRGR